MFYYLSQWRDIFSPLNLFQYITFRTGGAFITALLFCLLWGRPFIDLFKKLRIKQTIKTYGPESHMSKKETPTMGGILILGSMVTTTLLWADLKNRFIWLILILAIYLGAVGFLDDYFKWMQKAPKGKPRSPGLSENIKMTAIFIISLGVACYLYFYPPHPSLGTMVSIPYLKDIFIPLGGFYIFFALIVLTGASNAVNLTDGLDGLAGGTLTVCALSYAVLAYLAGHLKFSNYLRLIPISGAGELTIYLAAMAGACMGFLWFNSHPAEIFMGDTGSLSLGGTIGVVALCVKQELLLVIVGGIFVMEALSVILQIGSVRFRQGKRIFRMAPLHHHFEMMGIPESKVTIRFWIVSVILALIGLTSIKIR